MNINFESLAALAELSEKIKAAVPRIKEFLPMLKQLEQAKQGKELAEGEIIIYTALLTPSGIFIYMNVAKENEQGQAVILRQLWRGDLLEFLANMQQYLPI